MRLQQPEHFLKTGLDLRRGRGVRADEPDPVDHAGAHLSREGVMLLLAGTRCTHARDPAGRGDLIDVPGPAVVKHPFVAPFVAELFDQGGDKPRDGFVRMDRRLRVKLLDSVDNRGGILDANAVGSHHQRDDRHFGIFLEFRLACRIAQHPLMRNSLVAEIRADFDGVGRHFGADDAISVRQILIRHGWSSNVAY